MEKTSTLASAKSTSVWIATAEMPGGTPVSANVDTDVCIVGAGIAGLTTGYLLSKAGKRVVILDDGAMASGVTQLTTAHLSNAIDDRFVEIERWHGEEGARLAAESHAAAIDCIESISDELNINCDFQRLDGYLFLAPGDEKELLEKELAAAHRAGITDAELVDRLPFNSFGPSPAIRFPNQARVHPLKYLAAVAESIRKQGGRSSRIAMPTASKAAQ